jgi:undecaprenyl-diphosphatase
MKAVILGTIQGLSEFLPVSSSGHLVAFQHFLGFRSPQILFDVVVHFGTLLAVCFVYRTDLLEILKAFFLATGEIVTSRDIKKSWNARPYFRFAIYLVIGTLPAALAGVLLQDPLEKAFGSLRSAGSMLLVTGTVLFLTQRVRQPGRELESLSLKDVLIVGLAQAFALLPGISRSGMTISAGLFCGLNRDLSARFSFLLSVPAILGANALEFFKARKELATMDVSPFLTGGLTSLITGYLALLVLLRVVHRGRLYLFSYYCWALGTILLLVSFHPFS